jgi:phosphate transport system protein
MRPFEEGLNHLNGKVREMGALVAQSIHRSVQSLDQQDEDLASQVVRDEALVNQIEIQIGDLATSLLVREAPVARDMRFVVAAIKIATDLERMGDLAVSIVERSLVRTHQHGAGEIVFLEMGNLVESMVLTALDAFVKRDAQLAREVMSQDDAIDRLRNSITKQMVERMKQDSASIDRALDNILIARRLERIADHTTNIAEDVIFLVNGTEVRRTSDGVLRAVGDEPGLAVERTSAG